jgi:hypothetical protein
VSLSRTDLLNEAESIINGQRQREYGSAEDSFQIIASYWSTYLGIHIEPADVSLMMVLLKMGRIPNQGQPTTDTIIDMLGYAAIAGELCELD